MTILAVLSLALMGLNCKDSESPEDAIPDKFVGTWEADSTKEGTYIEVTQLGDLTEVGGEVRAVINKDETYSLTFSNLIILPDGTDQGKVTIDEEIKGISFVSDDPEVDLIIFFYTWEDDMLVLSTQYELGEVLLIVIIKLVKTS